MTPSPAARSGPLTITLDAPARGVAPGQAAVLYDGDLVLGSATITPRQPPGRRARLRAADGGGS